MSEQPAIKLEGVGKRYWQLEEQAMLLKSLIPFKKPKRHELWALRDVDLTINRGETVGILGHNGAGKTTLLRMLAGVTQPSVGQLSVTGRVAPLISVGVGFHPEMSGRENIYVNGMLLGLTKPELDERFDDIVAFAELHDFIDTPVKFYSSGMFMRLGFSVAIHVEPQILLVDEILAVGDIAFQLKCFDRMRKLIDAGATVVIVSHSMHAIRLLCPRALLFRKGQLEVDGDPETVIARHYEVLSTFSRSGERIESAPSGAVEVTERAIVGAADITRSVGPGDRVSARFKVRFNDRVESPHFVFKITSSDGQLAYSMHSDYSRTNPTYEAGQVIDVEVPFTVWLGGGTYRVGLQLLHKSSTSIIYEDQGDLLFVQPSLGAQGLSNLGADLFVDGELFNDHPDLLIARRESAASRAGNAVGGIEPGEGGIDDRRHDRDVPALVGGIGLPSVEQVTVARRDDLDQDDRSIEARPER